MLVICPWSNWYKFPLVAILNIVNLSARQCFSQQFAITAKRNIWQRLSLYIRDWICNLFSELKGWAGAFWAKAVSWILAICLPIIRPRLKPASNFLCQPLTIRKGWESTWSSRERSYFAGKLASVIAIIIVSLSLPLYPAGGRQHATRSKSSSAMSKVSPPSATSWQLEVFLGEHDKLLLLSLTWSLFSLWTARV